MLPPGEELKSAAAEFHEYFTYIFLFYGKSVGDARKKWLLYL